MLATIELGAEVALWVKDNAKPILAGTTILFAGLWSRSCIQSNGLSLELEACKAKPPTVQTVYVKQDCKQSVKVVYKDGSPCPDVTATNDSESAVSLTQTAGGSVGDKVSPLGPVTLGLGASYYSGLWHPSAGIGLALPRIGGYEFGAGLDVAAAAFDGTPGLDPQYGVKLTVRR